MCTLDLQPISIDRFVDKKNLSFGILKKSFKSEMKWKQKTPEFL